MLRGGELKKIEEEDAVFDLRHFTSCLGPLERFQSSSLLDCRCKMRRLFIYFYFEPLWFAFTPIHLLWSECISDLRSDEIGQTWPGREQQRGSWIVLGSVTAATAVSSRNVHIERCRQCIHCRSFHNGEASAGVDFGIGHWLLRMTHAVVVAVTGEMLVILWSTELPTGGALGQKHAALLFAVGSPKMSCTRVGLDVHRDNLFFNASPGLIWSTSVAQESTMTAFTPAANPVTCKNICDSCLSWNHGVFSLLSALSQFLNGCLTEDAVVIALSHL